MSRLCGIVGFASAISVLASSAFGGERADPAPRGSYLEARTCQVYTGPCFANGEVGLAGKQAVMSWSIQHGVHDQVDLSGLCVSMVVSSTHTLGFGGLGDARAIKSVIYVDERATAEEQRALVDFASVHAPQAAENVVEIRSVPIELVLDRRELTGNLQVGKLVTLKLRKARPNDCICSNESAYYPPLVELAGYVPGVTIEGDVSARALGSRWSIPDSRTAYLGTFHYR
jgi:hypothetical protein